VWLFFGLLGFFFGVEFVVDVFVFGNCGVLCFSFFNVCWHACLIWGMFYLSVSFRLVVFIAVAGYCMDLVFCMGCLISIGRNLISLHGMRG